jgi:ABC-type nitrate/sulfonate/bicarbonate transport system substrate-binding protein
MPATNTQGIDMKFKTGMKSVGRFLFAASLSLLVPLNAWAQSPKVVVATGIDPAFAPYVIAVKKDFFKNQGIDADFKTFDDGNVALDSLLTGTADIGGTSELGGLVRVARGGKIFLMASGTQYADFFGIAGKNTIKQPKDFEGKTVGMPKGSGAHLYFAKYGAFHKLDMSKINVRFLQAPEAIAALARGDIDAFFLWDPWLTRAVTTVPDTRIIARSGQDNIFRLNTYIWFSDKLQSDTELAKKAMKALVEAADWTMANRAEAAKIVGDAYHMPAATAEEIMKPMSWNINYNAVFNDYLLDAGEFAKSAGMVPAIPEPSSFMRPAPLKAIAPDRVKE